MDFTSINPFNGDQIATHQAHSQQEVMEVLDASQVAFQAWKKVELSERIRLIRRAGEVLRENVNTYATMITQEMGKPIKEARAEVLKCALVCDYYAENALGFLAPEYIETDATKSYVRHDPIGTVFAIMPWNFPFWQVFRYAAPTLTAGNCGILKHAANVYGSAKLIMDVLSKAGYPEGVFQNLVVGHDMTEAVIAHPAVAAITLTGSERAGREVASLAGKHLKKSLLELGGNNAFIVLEDADMDKAVQTALTARMLNCGQSCIAAKRFILMDGVYDTFVEKFIDGVSQLTSGDPLSEETQIGTLARKDLADELQLQVVKSIAAGAELLLGGKQNGCYHEPTVLGNVKPGMPAFDEETFGPLAAMIRVKDLDQAIEYAGMSAFGLGLTVCTRNTELAESIADQFGDGAFFVNELVKSDPRLPFGGTKLSGYGRELGKDGMMEFVNRKVVYVK